MSYAEPPTSPPDPRYPECPDCQVEDAVWMQARNVYKCDECGRVFEFVEEDYHAPA